MYLSTINFIGPILWDIIRALFIASSAIGLYKLGVENRKKKDRKGYYTPIEKWYKDEKLAIVGYLVFVIIFGTFYAKCKETDNYDKCISYPEFSDIQSTAIWIIVVFFFSYLYGKYHKIDPNHHLSKEEHDNW